MLRPRRLVLLALCVAACGGRNLPVDRDGAAHDGAAYDALLRDGAVDGPYVPPDGSVTGCASDHDCVVAVRTDNCCQAAYPELVAKLAGDQCLELWSSSGAVTILPECQAEWDPRCAAIDCMPAPPPSRVARCDQGACVFGTECSAPADCTLASNVRECCPCPVPVPKALLTVDACLEQYPAGGTPPRSCYPGACPAMPCGQCLARVVTCRGETCAWQ